MFACHSLQFPKDADFSYYKSNRSIKILESMVFANKMEKF